MLRVLNRFLSLAFCGAIAVAVHADTGSAEKTFRVCIGLIFPLACIWFGEELGQYTGFMRGHQITHTTPGCLVAAGGWFILVGAPLLAYLLSRGL
jgi:hypothetical protein